MSEVLTSIRGKHALKFGFEGRLHQQNYIQTNAPNGIFNFSSLSSSQCPVPDITQCGGDSMASFLMGQLGAGGGGTYQIQFSPATENYQYAGFVQDNWKVRPNLTLNLGLRYDVSLPRTERHNRTNWFDPNAVSPLNGGTISYVDPITQQTVNRALLGGELFNSANMRTNWETDWKDIQPRFGFAYQFGKNTVLRGGYGIYYDQTRSGANGLLSYGSQGFTQSTNVVGTYNNDGATPYLHLSDPYPNGLLPPTGSSLGLLNDVGYGAIGPLRTAAAAKTPYEQSWSFGIQQELGSSTVLDVEYIGKKGTHLYFAGANNLNVLGPQIQNLTPNQIGNLGDYVANPLAPLLSGPAYANSVLSSPSVQAFQLLLPYPQFTSVTSDEPPTADSSYHALQIAVEKRYSNGLQLLASYTWSKSIDNSSIYDTNVAWLANGPNSGSNVQNPNNLAAERSLSTFDVPSQLKFNYTYDLPVGRGRAFLSSMPRPLELVLGGWKTAGVWSIHSGFPLQFTVADGGSPIWTYGAQRPNLAGRPTRTGGSDANWINNYFANPDVFQIPDPYTLGNASRTIGSVRSPFFFSADLSILKQFDLSARHESLKLEMRLEAQNAFNHPVFGTPNTYVGDPDFGVVNYTAVGPRQCQLALKFYF